MVCRSKLDHKPCLDVKLVCEELIFYVKSKKLKNYLQKTRNFL